MPINTNVTPLKVKPTMVNKVDYKELERYIRDVTGKTIFIPEILECTNGTDHEITVGDHPEWLDKEEKEHVEKFLFGDGKYISQYYLPVLLDIMCINGLIEKGTYLIRVSW